MHTNLSNNKKYIGITSTKTQTRWQNGSGYKPNKKFYKDIVEFGWDSGFSHEIVKENLNSYEAREMEYNLIKKYDSIDNGYNNRCEFPYSFGEDIFDFPIIKKTDIKYDVSFSYFTKIPNEFIRCNIKKEYKLSRMFLITYILIDRNKNYENISTITIDNIMSKCGLYGKSKKTKRFFEVVKSMVFLKQNNYIDFDFDPYSIDRYDAIEIKIIKENFDCKENFTKIEWKTFDKIMGIETSTNKDVLICVFSYVLSFMFLTQDENGNQKLSAFYRNISNMATEIGMSKETLINSINLLIDEKILIKKIVGSIKQSDKPPQNVPNIYVLNQQGYQNEIDMTLQKMKELYSVDEFLPPTKTTKNKGENK